MHRKGQPPRFFTLIIIPHSSGAPKSFGVSSGVLLAAAAACLAAVMAIACLALYFYGLSGYYREMASGRKAGPQDTGEAGDRYFEAVKDLSQRLEELREGLKGLDAREREIKRLMGLEVDSPAGGGVESSYSGQGGPGYPGDAAGVKISRGMAVRRIPAAEDLEGLSARLKTCERTLEAMTMKVQADPEYYRSIPNGIPAKGRLTSKFGIRVSPFDGKKKEMHSAIDLAAPYGTEVKAAGDGVVAYSGHASGFGKMIVVDHGYGFKTYYGHNSRLLAGEGERVLKGQTIALMGSSGQSTGSHLHFAIEYGGQFIDPFALIDCTADSGIREDDRERSEASVRQEKPKSQAGQD